MSSILARVTAYSRLLEDNRRKGCGGDFCERSDNGIIFVLLLFAAAAPAVSIDRMLVVFQITSWVDIDDFRHLATYTA
jgi:hypothetical protein